MTDPLTWNDFLLLSREEQIEWTRQLLKSWEHEEPPIIYMQEDIDLAERFGSNEEIFLMAQRKASFKLKLMWFRQWLLWKLFGDSYISRLYTAVYAKAVKEWLNS